MQRARRTVRTMRLLSAAAVPLILGGACGLLGRQRPQPDRSADVRIRQAVEGRIAAEPALASTGIRVDVDAGVVLLYGAVPGIDGWRCAIRNAQLVEGVRTVVDYLVIERTPARVTCSARGPG